MIEKSEFDPKQIKEFYRTTSDKEANEYIKLGWKVIEVCKVRDDPYDSYFFQIHLAWLAEDPPKHSSDNEFLRRRIE